MQYISSIENTERKKQLLKGIQLLRETILVIIQDVAHCIKTENKLDSLNKELLYKADQLKELNKELYTIAHIAGNDLKGSLRKIYSYAEIALRDEGASMTNRAKSYCRKIQSAAQKMSLLTDDIGSLAIIDPETFKRDETDLNIILLHVKNQLEYRLLNKSITIDTQPLPAIQASELQIAGLFHNIIGTYIRVKAEDRPSVITITSGIVEGKGIDHPAVNDQKAYHLIRFSDNSGGFTITDTDSLFILYNYALHPQDKIGMELLVSKKICEMHGGFIMAESTTGKGNRLNCYFPTE